MLDRFYDTVDGLLDRLRGAEPPARNPFQWADWWLCGLCALVAAALASRVGNLVGNGLYTEGSFDIWFQGDTPRVVANLLDPSSNQYRAAVHPIFPILLTPWVSLIPNLGVPPLSVGKGMAAACGGLSAAVLFSTLRVMALPRPVSLLFTAAFAASAAFLHWYSVIEIAPLNGLSICLALFALAFGPTRRSGWWVLMSAFTLGMTTTNWSAGLAATIARWPVRRVVVITVTALAATATLSIVQRLIYPTANVFFDPEGLAREQQYVTAESAGWRPLENLRSMIVYSAVTPPPAVEGKVPDAFVTNQHQSSLTADGLGLAAMAAWIAMLGCGALGAITYKPARPVALGLGLMLAGQIGLGLVYGDVTFLYAANIMPMLSVLAALSWFTPLRWLVVALAMVVIAAGGINNIKQLRSAVHLVANLLDEGGNRKWSRYPAGRFILPVPPPNRSLR